MMPIGGDGASGHKFLVSFPFLHEDGSDVSLVVAVRAGSVTVGTYHNHIKLAEFSPGRGTEGSLPVEYAEIGMDTPCCVSPEALAGKSSVDDVSPSLGGSEVNQNIDF
jgi:hypothetical protein